MGTALVVNDILSCKVWSTLGSQAAVNTYNYKVIAVSGGAVTDQDFCDVQEPGMATFYKGFMPSSALFNGVQVYFLQTSSVLPAAVFNRTNSGFGTKGTTPAPKNTSCVLKYKTPLRGPSQRGRIFLPFASIDWLDVLGDPTSPCNVYVNSFCSLLLPPIVVTVGGNTATLVWSIVHRHPKPAPLTTSQITEANIAGKFGQMHKRGDYGRPNTSPI